MDRTEQRITSNTGGQKGSKVAEIGAVDPLALIELAEVAGIGARKYSAYNFARGYDYSLSYNALQRHAMLWWAGESDDEESGRSHMAHVAWHALCLLTFSLRGVGVDDRITSVLGSTQQDAEGEDSLTAVYHEMERMARDG